MTNANDKPSGGSYTLLLVVVCVILLGTVARGLAEWHVSTFKHELALMRASNPVN